jgi:hypothetical protein
MKRLARFSLTPVLPAIIIGVPFPDGSDAYLDPGTGSVILQMGIAALIGGLFAVKIFWTRIRSFFGSLFSRGGKSEIVQD